VRVRASGSRRFNDLRCGVPRMSSSLLAQRLRRLEAFGTVRRQALGKVRPTSTSSQRKKGATASRRRTAARTCNDWRH